MAPKILVESDIQCGKRLVEKLDEQGASVGAALWVYNADNNRYQLVIGSENVDTEGTRPIYAKIRHALNELPENERVPLTDIAVTSLSEGVVATLSGRIDTPPNVIGSTRLTDDVVNRQLIEDAYVYRMSVRVAKPDPDAPTIDG